MVAAAREVTRDDDDRCYRPGAMLQAKVHDMKSRWRAAAQCSTRAARLGLAGLPSTACGRKGGGSIEPTEFYHADMFACERTYCAEGTIAKGTLPSLAGAENQPENRRP
jgi:hypothetical protein